MGHRISLGAVVVPMVAFWLLSIAVPAFAFLYVEENAPLPHLQFQEVVSGKMKAFDGSIKRPLVLIFWGADIDTKRERAIEVLGYIQEARAFYQERNIELAAVFVQPEQVSLLKEVVDRVHLDFPIYVDSESQSFEKLGVYVMPSILIVSEDGIVHKGLGYTRNLEDILHGEIKIMLHEKTREEVNSELHPDIVERTTAQRRARLDYNYALNLVLRQKLDLALEKLDMALEKDPEFLPALVEKGCLLVKKEKFQEAAGFLERSLGLAPEFKRALTCKDELKAAERQKGQGAKAPGKSDPASWGFFADDGEEGSDSPE